MTTTTTAPTTPATRTPISPTYVTIGGALAWAALFTFAPMFALLAAVVVGVAIAVLGLAVGPVRDVGRIIAGYLRAVLRGMGWVLPPREGRIRKHLPNIHYGPVASVRGGLVLYGLAWRAGLALVVVLLAMLALPVPVPLRLLVLVEALAALGGAHRRAPAPDQWWSERRLVGALTSAGVLRPTRPDQPQPMLGRKGPPVVREGVGTTITVALPPGMTASDVTSKHDRLASAMGLSPSRLHVAVPDGAAAGVLAITVSDPQVAGSVVVASVAGAARTDWRQPVRIGRTALGTPVLLQTDEQCHLFAGQPGSGKTTTARLVLGSYLLDPRTMIFLLDGKGSRRDYEAARPSCERFVFGTDEDCVEATLSMFGEVLEIIRDRNRRSDQVRSWPGVLLLAEEYQDCRSAADRVQREQLDATLARIIRLGRAVSVSVLISTQRPSVDDLPSGSRNLITNRLALTLRNGADAALVLGFTPTLPLPRKRGEALLTTPTGTTAVLLDYLDDTAWKDLCKRAAALRPARKPTPAAAPTAPQTAPPAAVLDPLVDAVVNILRDADPAGLPAAAILEQLDWLAPSSAAKLGRMLGAFAAEGAPIEPGFRGSQRVWRTKAPVGDPSVTRR